MSPWSRELNDFARAFAGAYIFGMPLLFTMEMWWIGEYADLARLISFVALGLVTNIGLAHVVGFKREKHTLATSLHQAVDALAVGMVAAVVVLAILNRIRLTDSLDSIASMIVVQSVPLSIGASVANQVFGRHGEKNRQGDDNDAGLSARQELFADVGATIIGGVFVGFSIAPTDEIGMIAAGLELGHVLLVIGFSLLMGYVIVFASGFDPSSRAEGLFQRPITETTLAYVVSLIVALVTLYLFHQVGTKDPLHMVVQQTIVLGMPTAIGGAAGRLVI